mmetsp:Transcript_36170/g.84728  ORF Transcript_36170/g.84728 Transcript_36170/m.84728 type:complete len:369 (-) Transcript_36170:676-1782(-)
MAAASDTSLTRASLLSRRTSSTAACTLPSPGLPATRAPPATSPAASVSCPLCKSGCCSAAHAWSYMRGSLYRLGASRSCSPTNGTAVLTSVTKASTSRHQSPLCTCSSPRAVCLSRTACLPAPLSSSHSDTAGWLQRCFITVLSERNALTGTTSTESRASAGSSRCLPPLRPSSTPYMTGWLVTCRSMACTGASTSVLNLFPMSCSTASHPHAALRIVITRGREPCRICSACAHGKGPSITTMKTFCSPTLRTAASASAARNSGVGAAACPLAAASVTLTNTLPLGVAAAYATTPALAFLAPSDTSVTPVLIALPRHASFSLRSVSMHAHSSPGGLSGSLPLADSPPVSAFGLLSAILSLSGGQYPAP